MGNVNDGGISDKKKYEALVAGPWKAQFGAVKFENLNAAAAYGITEAYAMMMKNHKPAPAPKPAADPTPVGATSDHQVPSGKPTSGPTV